jgi:hypothetical protein
VRGRHPAYCHPDSCLKKMGRSESLTRSDGYSLDTAVIHAGMERVKGAAVFPIFQSVTYGYSENGSEDSVAYSRPADTPNHQVGIKATTMRVTSTDLALPGTL